MRDSVHSMEDSNVGKSCEKWESDYIKSRAAAGIRLPLLRIRLARAIRA